jgi:hypothetical protein
VGAQGALRLYPIGFFVVLVGLLLQRPHDRNAWLVALLFAGFIAAAPLAPDLVHERGLRAAVVEIEEVVVTPARGADR